MITANIKIIFQMQKHRLKLMSAVAFRHFNNHQNRSFRSEAALNALYSHNSNTLILYNYPSPSGVYAALFANFYHSTLKDSALVLPFSAVEPLRLIDFKCGRSFETCYLLDFIGPNNFAVQLSQMIPKVVAFDHRQSSTSKLGKVAENLELHINTCMSSARIAYEYFLTRINETKIEPNYIEEIMNDEEKDRVENVLKYIEDLDLRTFELRNIEAFRIGIREEMSKFNCVTNPYIFEQLLELDYNDLIAKGESYLNSRQIAANNLLEKAFKIRLGRGKHGECLAIRADGNSDLCHEMCLELSRRSATAGLRSIGAAVFMRRNKNLKMCLRTTDTQVDTSQIAKEYGGGGKPNASSFIIRMDEYNYWTGMR